MQTQARWLAMAGLVMAVSAPAAGADTVYKVIDPDGTVRYTDRPPAAGRGTKTLEFRHLPASPLPESAQRFRADIERRLQARAGSERVAAGSDVQLFTAAWCPHCKRAKADLAQRGVAYTEHDVDTPAGMEAFVRAAGQSVPLLVTPQARVQGYAQASYDEALAALRQRR